MTTKYELSWSSYIFKVHMRNEKGDCPTYCIFFRHSLENGSKQSLTTFIVPTQQEAFLPHS